jgi:hypothetical protein
MVAPVVAGSGNTKLDAFDDVSLVLSFNEGNCATSLTFIALMQRNEICNTKF